MRFEESAVTNGLVIKALDQRITADVAPEFKEALISFVTAGNRIIILDLSEVSFIDSSGLGALIGSLKVIGEDGELLLSGARESVVSMFKLTRMNKVFRMFKSVPEAVAAIA
jgi:anti-sigma B factor antagonist